MEYPTVGHFFLFLFSLRIFNPTLVDKKRQLREKITTVRTIPILRCSVTGAMRTATARVRDPVLVHSTSPPFHAPKKPQFAAPPRRINQSKSKQRRRQSIVTKRPGLASSAVSRKLAVRASQGSRSGARNIESQERQLHSSYLKKSPVL